MADIIYPGNRSEPAEYTVGSLDVNDNQPVSAYASQPQQYAVENLEVHDPNAVQHSSKILHPLGNSFKFSRRRAMVVSLIITLIIIILTAVTMLFLVRYGSKQDAANKLSPQQDVSLKDAQDSVIPNELKGTEQSLLVNGDIVTRGVIKVSDGTNVTTLRVAAGGTSSQTITLPAGSGTICLSSNNCGFASDASLTDLQGQLSGLEGNIAELREQLGTLSDPLSGLGNGFVKSTSGVLGTVANVNLASADISGVLAVSNGGTGVSTIPANALLLGNGTSALTTVSSGGAGLCLISTLGAPVFQACPGGGGGSFTVTGTSGASETISGGDTLLIAAGNNVTTTTSATDTITVATVNNPNFTTSVSTPLLQSSGALSITPGGALTVGATGQAALLQGSTTTITSNGAGNDIVLTSADKIQLTGFNCGALGNGGKLTTDGSGNLSCAADNGGSGTAITGTSAQTGRLAAFTGAQTVADSWLLQNGSTIEIDNTRNLSLMGGNFSVTGTGLFSGLISANGGITVSAGNSFSLNGEAFTDLTGTGLSFSSGTLQTTLGTSVDLTLEVTGVLPVISGGTGVNGSTAANGQLLIGNGTGYTLANITAGSGITINNGAGSIQVVNAFGTSIDSSEITDLTVANADIANGTIDLSTKTTGNYVATVAGSGQVSVTGSGSNNAAVTLGLVADSIGDSQLAFNTGQNLTTASTPGFAGLNVTGGTITVGTSSQLASMVLNDGNGQTTTLRPGDSTGNLTFTLPTADGTANQCIKTNASGALSFGNCLPGLSGTGAVTGSGAQDRLSKFDSSGTNIVNSTLTDDGTNVTTTVSMIVQGGGLTLGTNLQNAALTLYGNGFTAGISATGITANNTYNFPSGVGGDFCIKQNNNCSGSGGGNAPTTAQYLTLALDSGLSAERTLSFNGTNFSVVDNGANNSYTVNTAQNINSTATPTFSGLTLGGAGTLTVAGLTTLNGGLTVEAGDTLTFNGDAITDLTGNGLQVTTNTLTLQVQASKGIEVDGSGISLIDCANGQILKYNTTGSQWACGADAGGSGVGDNVSVNGTGANDADFVNTTATGSVAGTSFTLNVSTPDQIKVAVSVASATIAGVVDTNAQTFAGAKTFNANITAAGGLTLGSSQSLTAAGDSIQDFTGNGLQVGSNTLSVLLDTGSGLSSSASGVSLLRTCNSSEILKWNGSAWACSTDAGGSGVGDDITVNSVAATNANFLNSSASATAAAITWGLNTVSNPDDITISLGAANGTDAGLVTANAQTFGGAKTFNAQITAAGGVALSASQSLTANGDAIQDFTGNGLQVTSNVLNILAQTNRGLTVGASGIGLISSCATGEILKYNTAAGGTWACSTDAGGSGVGDDIQVNGSAVSSTGNFVNTTATNSIASTTWTLNAGSPDQITVAIGAASGTDAGIVTATGSQSFGGAKTFNGDLTVASTASFAINKGADYSTVGATSDVNFGAASLIRLTGATAQTINSILAGRDGQLLTLINAGANDAIIKNNTGATAANKILTGAGDVTLKSDASITLVYDTGASRWRVVGDAADSGCTTCANTSLSNLASTNINAALNATDTNLTLQTSGSTGGDVFVTAAGSGKKIKLQSATDVTGALTVSSGLITANAGLAVLAGQNLTVNGDAIQDLTGNGLQVTSNALNILAQTNRGLTVGASGIGLISSCATGEILKYNTAAGGTWSCAADAGGSGVGDDVQVNGSGVTNTANFVNTAASAGTVAATTWTLTPGSPDQITLAIGAANGTDAGIVTATGSQTFGGAKTFNGNVTLASTSSFATTSGGTYTTAGPNNNDVALSTASLWRLDTAGVAQNITGIVAGTRDGQVLTLINADPALNVTIQNDSASSSAANRIYTGAGVLTLVPNASITLIYDSGSTHWRVVGDAADSGCSTCANTSLSNLSSVDVGAAVIGSSNAAGLNLQSTGGNINLTPNGASALVNILTGNLQVGNGTPNVTLNGEDAYIEGTLEVDGASRFDGTVAFNDNVTVATGKYLRISGDTTANRATDIPSPNEGALFYDTTTKQLLTYANGKWQADRRDAIYVASSLTSSQADIDAADYVADGNTGAALDGDQVEINLALAAASGKKVILLAGTYTVDASVSVPNNTTLSGVGRGTLITIPNSFNNNINAIVNGDASTGTGVAIENLRLDGNKSNQASNTNTAISFSAVGDFATARHGGTIRGLWVSNWRSNALHINADFDVEISGNTINDNSGNGINIWFGDNIIVTDNTIFNNGTYGVESSNSTNNTKISNNTIRNNASGGVNAASNAMIIQGNTLQDNGGATTNNAVFLDGNGDASSITGNTISDSSATTNNYAINVSVVGATSNYISDNNLINGTVNDLGTGTIYGGQVNKANTSGNYSIQPAGTVELMKDTNVTGNLVVTGTTQATRFISTVATGTAPLTVSSTTLVTNLNADLLDGQTGSYYQDAGNINAGTLAVNRGGSGAGTFTQFGVLFGNGTSAFGVTAAGTANQCLLGTGTGITAPVWGTCTVATLQSVYDTSGAPGNPGTATSVLLANGQNLQFTAADTVTDPSVIFKLNCSACGTGNTGNFLVQNNAGTPDILFSVAGNGAIQIGGGNGAGTFGYISLGGSGGKTTGSFTLNGTARNTKRISLTPEFTGAVLDAVKDIGGATNCNLNNNGTMTSGLDDSITGFENTTQNYYKWSVAGGVAGNQCYDVVVQVPLPADWNGWASSTPVSLNGYKSTTSGSNLLNLQILDNAGTAASGCNYVAVTPGAAAWSANTGACNLSTGSPAFAAGGYITLKIRMTTAAGLDVRLGNIYLSYLSSF